MPLDWSNYDAFFNVTRQQTQIDQTAKQELETLSAEILQLDPSVLNVVWGACSPPGVSAQTVIRISGETSHRFSHLSKGKAVGLKLFKLKNGPGAPRQSDVAHAHVELRPKLPGLPSDFVQEVYCADQIKGRYYLVQEWIEGESLGDVLDRNDALSVSEVRGILRDLFEGILIPLWSVGTIWWDVRDDNYCLTPDGNGRRLVMIDTDSLIAYAKEIVETPEDFTRRDKTKKRAMQRVKTIVEKLAWSPFIGANVPRKEDVRLKGVISAIRSQAEHCFLQPGRLVGGEAAFEQMLKRFDTAVWNSPLAFHSHP
ncbi:MAG: hypothetical protein EBR81_08160 [Proteobacteria bacterium]|nr:hypothetical protein [Pseudomonadota bacterium]